MVARFFLHHKNEIIMKTLTSIIVIALSCISLTLSATKPNNQKKTKIEKPNLEVISEAVNNPESKYYYPNLMKRYEANDTVMVLDDYRYLYYGYIFQEDYDPYRHSEFSEKVEDLYYIKKHAKSQCDSIIKYAELSLKDNPFDLAQMSFLIYALREKRKNNLANIWQYRLNRLLETIYSSGTGIDKENAWYVIYPQHEYNLINFQGMVATGQEFIEPYYDFIKVGSTDEKSPEGYYFYIEPILKEYYRKFPEEVIEPSLSE